MKLSPEEITLVKQCLSIRRAEVERQRQDFNEDLISEYLQRIQVLLDKLQEA
jgi:hypothetical protein